MSFLNPVNEPVIIFSSTDAGAPQIDHNARKSGDIKAIFKSCLVTGYGATASAGWTATKDTLNILEVVSPSTSMSEYKLGLDDRTAANTTWYYLYKNVRTTPANISIISKSILNIDLSNPSNGWQLLVTPRGIFFIEIFYATDISALVGRVTYWGAIKSALANNSGVNIACWCVGHESPATLPSYFFEVGNTAYRHFRLSNFTLTDIVFAGTNINTMGSAAVLADPSILVEVASPLYLYRQNRFIGEHPAMVMKDNNSVANRYGVYNTTFDGRPAKSICLTYSIPGASYYQEYSKTILLYLDYWEY